MTELTQETPPSLRCIGPARVALTDRRPVQPPAVQALSRLLSVAMWVQDQTEPFTFEELREALPHRYVGTFASVDRMWSRDKLHLGRLGLSLVGDGSLYEVDEGSFACRRRLTASDLTLLRVAVDRVPDLSPAVRPFVSSGIRKLVVAGATPEVAARLLSSAPSRLQGFGAGSTVGGGSPTSHRLTAAYLLLTLLPSLGENGLSEAEAIAVTGLSSRQELRVVLDGLGGASVPAWSAPRDETGVLLEGGRVFCYLPTPAVRPLALGQAERELTAALLGAVEGEVGASLSAWLLPASEVSYTRSVYSAVAEAA